MAIKMVREPSETPNITNIDDIIPFRYAYGNQNGYVLGRGTEISNTINGLNFTVNSGRLVVQGVECDIDASGVTLTIDNIATKRYYTAYLQVNLGLNTATVLATYDTATYPNPPASDDLTENSTGTAYLVLYHFTATSGVIGEVEKIVQGIQYINVALVKTTKVDNAANSDNSQKVNNIAFTREENNKILSYNSDSSTNIGDISVIQRELLSRVVASIPTNASLTVSNLEVQVGDTLEVEVSYRPSSLSELPTRNDAFKLTIDSSSSCSSEVKGIVYFTDGTMTNVFLQASYNNNQLSFQALKVINFSPISEQVEVRNAVDVVVNYIYKIIK